MDADAHIDRGLELLDMGDFEEALKSFDQALALHPNNADALYNRGAALQALQRHAEAVEAYEAALTNAPGNADILFNLAGSLFALDRANDAIDAMDSALRQRPNDEQGLMQLHQVLMQQQQYERAVVVGGVLARVSGNSNRARDRRGVALLAAGRYDVALSDFDAILTNQPDDGVAMINRGAALLGLGRLEESAQAFETGLARAPQMCSGWYGLGLALFHLGRREEGLAKFEAYRDAAPDSADPPFAKAIRLLSLGRYAEAWPLYERRWHAPIARMGPPRDQGEPAWNGERIDGLLRVWAEQGPGDQILFARFLGNALQRTPRVVYACQARFAALMQRSFPGLERVAAEQEFHPGDAASQTALASLAHLFAITLAALDGRAYLRADETRVAELRAKYGALTRGRPIVGIAWASSNMVSGAQKTASLSRWGALLRQPYQFVNLQYGSAARDARDAEREFGCAIHDDASIDQMTDFDAFAAQIAALDAVVSVSNTTVHMAGALGVPCFVLPPPASGLHWYWGLDDETTPWYASVRLMRRARSEGWDAQIERAVARLTQYLGTRRP